MVQNELRLKLNETKISLPHCVKVNYYFVCFDFYIGGHHCKAINFLTDFLIFNKIEFALD